MVVDARAGRLEIIEVGHAEVPAQRGERHLVGGHLGLGEVAGDRAPDAGLEVQRPGALQIMYRQVGAAEPPHAVGRVEAGLAGVGRQQGEGRRVGDDGLLLRRAQRDVELVVPHLRLPQGDDPLGGGAGLQFKCEGILRHLLAVYVGHYPFEPIGAGLVCLDRHPQLRHLVAVEDVARLLLRQVERGRGALEGDAEDVCGAAVAGGDAPPVPLRRDPAAAAQELEVEIGADLKFGRPFLPLHGQQLEHLAQRQFHLSQVERPPAALRWWRH